MKKSLYGLLFLFCAVATARAQTQPVVEVDRIISAPRPHLPPQRVGVGNCYGLSAAQSVEELATIKVSIPGPSERTAEHLAKEKAGEIGANCLFPLREAGEDNMRAPVQRVYKALRVTIQAGSYQIPASPGDFQKAAPAPKGSFQAAGFQPLKPPEKHSAHLGWLSGKGVEKYEIIINTAGIEPAVWENIIKDVIEFFPEGEAVKLRQAGQNGAIVGIDLAKFKVYQLKAGRLNPGELSKEQEPAGTVLEPVKERI